MDFIRGCYLVDLHRESKSGKLMVEWGKSKQVSLWRLRASIEIQSRGTRCVNADFFLLL